MHQVYQFSSRTLFFPYNKGNNLFIPKVLRKSGNCLGLVPLSLLVFISPAAPCSCRLLRDQGSSLLLLSFMYLVSDIYLYSENVLNVIEMDLSYPRCSRKTKPLLLFSCIVLGKCSVYLNQRLLCYRVVQMVLQCLQVPQKQPSSSLRVGLNYFYRSIPTRSIP